MKRQKRERTSYAFLMEMMWVCAFFLICACIFVLAFARAEQMSRRADSLNRAVQSSSNTLEDLFAAFGDATALSDQPDRWEEAVREAAETAGSQYSTGDYTLQIEPLIEDGLLTVTVRAVDSRDGSVLYTISGARAGRRLP